MGHPRSLVIRQSRLPRVGVQACRFGFAYQLDFTACDADVLSIHRATIVSTKPKRCIGDFLDCDQAAVWIHVGHQGASFVFGQAGAFHDRGDVARDDFSFYIGRAEGVERVGFGGVIGR